MNISILRKIEKRIENFFRAEAKKALLITGARQVGKTFSIRQFGEKSFRSFIEINFLEDKAARKLFEQATDSEGLLLRLSALSGKRMIPGETLIFFDEVQECPEVVTAIKFLVEEGSYRYILSGSLLGVELKDIRSMPVGYMDIMEMYPLDFEEFATASGVSKRVMDTLRACFENRKPADPLIHEKMMEVFRLYLIVGGMPAAVMKYLRTSNLREVEEEQQSILRLYKRDIGKYDPENKLYLEDIFSLIPSELNSKNKRFIMKDLNENFKFSRFNNSFIWLRDAGTALPVFCASEPEVPLLLSKSTNLFKLFLSDVGLLAAMYMNDIQLKILSGEIDINFGAVYENAAAQELSAHGYDLYYFNNKKQGEVDFLIEESGRILPIEIKSGKNYTKHSGLSNLLNNKKYGISEAFIFYNGNVEQVEKVIYYPIYMLTFLKKKQLPEELIYHLDIDILKE